MTFGSFPALPSPKSHHQGRSTTWGRLVSHSASTEATWLVMAETDVISSTRRDIKEAGRLSC